MPLTNAATQVSVLAFDLNPVGESADGLIVGHATRGKIGAAAGNKLRSAGQMAATDLTCYVESIRIERGRRDVFSAPEASRCVIRFDAADRRFDPLYNAGAYNGGVSRQRFRRMLPMMVAVTGLVRSNGTVSTRRFPLFSGWVDEVSYDYGPTGALFGAEVSLIDAFGLLATVDLNAAPEEYGPNETLSARMVRWAELAGITGGAANLTVPTFTDWVEAPNSAGRYGVHAFADATYQLAGTNLSANAATAVKATAASSDAWVWVAADGALSWKPIPTTSKPSQPALLCSDAYDTSSWTVAIRSTTADFAGTGNATMSNAKPRLDPGSFANVVRMARDGGEERVAANTTGSESDGKVEFNRTDMLNANDTDVANIAAWVVTRNGGRPPVTVSFELEPWLADRSLYLALDAELNTMVGWEWTQVGLEVRGPVMSISHDIRPGRDWRMGLTVTEWLGGWA